MVNNKKEETIATEYKEMDNKQRSGEGKGEFILRKKKKEEEKGGDKR